MDLVVINLDRTPDRLAAFQAANRHVPAIRRVSAVDGRALDRAALAAAGLIEGEIPHSDGALGNALSHIALWDAWRDRGRALTVCEDDAVLAGGFGAHAERLLAGLPDDWDVVLWGWNFDSGITFDMLPGVAPCQARFGLEPGGLGRFPELPVDARLFRLFRAFGLIAYTVSPRGMGRLRTACVPLRPTVVCHPDPAAAVPNVGLDVALMGAYPMLNAYVSFPPLAITANDRARSTVQTMAANGLGA